MTINVWSDSMQHIELLGKPALFSDSRVDRSTVPDGWYVYDLRGSDYDPDLISTLEARVIVNYAGSILTPEPVIFPDGQDYLDTPIEMRFIGLDRMAREFDGPNPSQYRIAYDGQAESQELEDIWNKFCRRTLPGGDHPLAISDVIELYDVDGSAFYYVDKREIVSVDFTPVIHENMNTPEPSRKDGSDQRLFQKLEQEYLAYLEPLRSAALSELLEKAGEIADTQAVYRCLCENTGLSTEQKEKLATLEQPLQAIRDRWRQTHPTPEPELLEACEALTTSQQQSEETPALSMTL